MLRRSRVRALRWLVQLSFLGLFIFSFAETRYAVPVTYQNILFRFDPLVFAVVTIAYRLLLTASLLSLFVLIATLVFGRFFCGFICPLGTTIDIFGLTVRKRKERPGTFHRGKYVVLIFLAGAGILGVSFVHFFDPLAILERSMTLVFYPAAAYLAGLAGSGIEASYAESAIALVALGVILGLDILTQRFWCRNVCPLGGLLAFLSKFSVFKFIFGDGCTECSICERICPTHAVSIERRRVDPGECIACLRCVHECPQHVIRYRAPVAPAGIDLTRRHLITALGASAVIAPLARTVLHQRLSGRLIRPPGAIPESDFLNVCIHCGKCMKVCPTNGLQPCLLEAGVNGIWTPRLACRIGGCEKNCNMCGQVCPTSAIRDLPLDEKTYAKIGTAVIDRARCIAWEQDRICLICDEACPYGAISSLDEKVRSTTLPRPFVDERICTGCGLCESRCPIEGRAAIEIYSIGEERMRKGSYVTDEKIRLRACEEREEDIPPGFIIDN